MKLNVSPPPNRYKINRDLIKKKPYKQIGNTHIFAQKIRKKKPNMIKSFFKYNNIE